MNYRQLFIWMSLFSSGSIYALKTIITDFSKEATAAYVNENDEQISSAFEYSEDKDALQTELESQLVDSVSLKKDTSNIIKVTFINSWMQDGEGTKNPEFMIKLESKTNIFSHARANGVDHGFEDVFKFNAKTKSYIARINCTEQITSISIFTAEQKYFEINFKNGQIYSAKSRTEPTITETSELIVEEPPKELTKDGSRFIMYTAHAGLELYVPASVLSTVSDIRELLNNYGISTISDWTEKDWEIASSILKLRSKKPIVTNRIPLMVDIRNLSRLLIDAKSILKSFLLTDDMPFDIIRSQSMEKKGLNRLFTYAELQETIKKKNLSHVKLAQKILAIKDKTTGEYLKNEQARKVIDHIFKIYSTSVHLNLVFEYYSSRYDFIIFAKKESINGKGLSQKTMDELMTLCQTTPFDIGYGNIFWDSNGDAIIIDTEYKGEHIISCEKLSRYPIDTSLR